MSETVSSPAAEGVRPADTRLTHFLYLMHGLAPFTVWLLAVAAIVIGIATRDHVHGTWLESHYSWLSRTFWWALVWIAICALLTGILFVLIIGILFWWLPWTVLFFWYLYRVVRGWLRLNEGKPAPY
jgi:uncharacterized membrane protein